MALGLLPANGSGDFLDRVQFDSKAGRWHRIDRSQNSSGEWEQTAVEIKPPFKAMIDLEHTEIGFIKLANGVDFKMNQVEDGLPQKPSDEHKQGFRVKLYAPKTLGTVRHWSSTARGVIAQVDALHTQWTSEAPKHPGKVPLVEIGDVFAVTTGQGAKRTTNYSPTFAIVDWKDRPAELTGDGGLEESNAAPTPAPAPAARAKASTVAPPAAKPAPVVDDDDPEVF